MMIRHRKKAGYKQFNNLDELSDSIRENEKINHIYQGIVRAGRERAIIFSSTELLKTLNEQEELYMDGTFKVN